MTRSRTAPRALAVLLAATLAAGTAPPAEAAFNVFSVEQDVEIGRQSAAQAERQLPILDDRSVDAYLNDIVRRLAAQAPGPRFPYQIKAVNATDVNAFALPGGYLYVNRGLVEAARTEGELAGVLAHEMAHVALRHGTNQASKAYLAQAGLGILGGLIGGEGRTGQIIGAVGGLGLNVLFLKFSRGAETEADVAAAQMLARAGYDPVEMATFFDRLQGSRAPEFLSSHPNPGNRAARVRQEAQRIGFRGGSRDSGQLAAVQSDLRRYPAGRSTRGMAGGAAPSGQAGSLGRVSLEGPSGRYRVYEHDRGFYALEYPENWQVYEDASGFGVTIAPRGGVVQDRGGNTVVVAGMMVNHYEPFDTARVSGRVDVRTATRDLLAEIQRANPHLRVARGERRGRTSGWPSMAVELSGRAPSTGEEEYVRVVTREMADGHVLYSVFVAPRRFFTQFDRAFARAANTLQVDDRFAHR